MATTPDAASLEQIMFIFKKTTFEGEFEIEGASLYFLDARPFV